MPDPARLPNRLTEPQAYIDALVARLAAAEEFISKREQIAEAMADRLAAAEKERDEWREEAERAAEYGRQIGNRLAAVENVVEAAQATAEHWTERPWREDREAHAAWADDHQELVERERGVLASYDAPKEKP